MGVCLYVCLCVSMCVYVCVRLWQCYTVLEGPLYSPPIPFPFFPLPHTLPLLPFSCSPPSHWTSRSNGWTNQPSLLAWHTPLPISSDSASEEKTHMTRMYCTLLTVLYCTVIRYFVFFMNFRSMIKQEKKIFSWIPSSHMFFFKYWKFY